MPVKQLRFRTLFILFTMALCSGKLIAQKTDKEIHVLLSPVKNGDDTVLRKAFTFTGNAKALALIPESLSVSIGEILQKYPVKEGKLLFGSLASVDQSAYQRFRRHILDSLAFEKMRKNFNIDTNLVSKTPINDNIFFYYAKLTDGKNLVVVDADMNKSFTGDSVYISSGLTNADTIQGQTLQQFITDIPLSNAEFYSGKLYKINTRVDINVRETIMPNRKDSISVLFQLKNGREGVIHFPGKDIMVYVKPTILLDKLKYDKFCDIRLVGSEDKTIHKIGDTVYINTEKYLLKEVSITGDEIVFIKLQNENASVRQFGSEIGQTAQDFDLPDGSNKNFNLEKNSRSRYILIDFWGTWCGPCLENLPKLREFYNTIKRNDSIELLGICVDDLTDKKDLLKKIAKLNIPWKNLLVDRNLSFSSATTIVNRYKISAFPTYILIGPDRTIISRDVGEKGLQTVLDKIPGRWRQ